MKAYLEKIRFEVFVSPGFLIALGVLLLNDYYLKSEYSNWLTGKLSDFSGLFLFSLFWLAFFPGKERLIVILTGVAFAAWKSPLSQPLIDFWNHLSIIQVSRVIDWSDLTALAVLPLSRRYFVSLKGLSCKKALAYPVVLLSLFSIIGTSQYYPRHHVNFYMQAVEETQAQSDEAYPVTIQSKDVNELIGSIAERHALSYRAEVSTTNYSLYIGDGIYMETNFDDHAKTIFVDISGHTAPGKEEELPPIAEEVDNIQEEIFTALNGRFKNLTVKKYSRLYGREDTVTTIEIKSPLVGLFIFFGCEIKGKRNEEIMLALEVADDYLRQHKGVVSVESYRYEQGSCVGDLFRTYVMGKVLGARRLDRSTTVKVRFYPGWFDANLYIDFIEHSHDSTVDIRKMAEELEQALRQALKEDTVVQVVSEQGK